MPARTPPPRHVAIHEAGHSVARWALQRQLGRHWDHFHSVMIRSIEEMHAGPYRDDRGREVNCSGLLNALSRYIPMGADNVRQLERKCVDAMRVEMEIEVLQALAGPAAEARYRHFSATYVLMTGGSEDWAAAERIPRDFTDKSELARTIDAFYERAKRLLDQPGPW